jgi:hypothetical protein
VTSNLLGSNHPRCIGVIYVIRLTFFLTTTIRLTLCRTE